MNKNFLLSSAFVTFVAAWLRFYDLTHYHAGLLLDEMWMALNARNIREGVTACCSLYFSLPFGGHPLFVYLSIIAQQFIAPPFAGRTLSAILGILSVVSLIFIFRSLTQDSNQHADWIGIVGGFTLATTVSHITFSRAGLETLLASVFAIPLIWLIYQTYQKESWKYAIACGVVLGLSFYSYAPAAAFPIALVAFAALRLINLQPSRLKILKLTLLVLAISFVVITPFLYTIFFTPNQYLAHLLGTTQSTRSGNIFIQIFDNLMRVIGGVSLAGQITAEHNFQGQPLFNPIISVFFWMGFIIAIIRAWRKQPLYQLMLVWALCCSLPTIFSDHAPNFARWLIALPAFVFFVSTSVIWIWERLSDSIKQQNWLLRSSQFGTSLILILFASFTFYQSTATYFSIPLDKRSQMWATQYRLNAEKAIDYSKTALVFASPMGEPLIQPVFDLMLRDTNVNQIDGRVCLPLASNESRSTLYNVISVSDNLTLDRLKKIFPSGRIVAEVLDSPNAYPYSQFYEVPPNTKPNLNFNATQTQFTDGMILGGYNFPPSAKANDIVSVDLYWRIDQRLNDELIVFTHFVRVGEGQPLVQHDDSPCSKGMPTTRWVTNALYPDRHDLKLPSDLKPGQYEVRVGVYRWPSQERLMVVTSEKKILEDTVLVLGVVEVK